MTRLTNQISSKNSVDLSTKLVFKMSRNDINHFAIIIATISIMDKNEHLLCHKHSFISNVIVARDEIAFLLQEGH